MSLLTSLPDNPMRVLVVLDSFGTSDLRNTDRSQWEITVRTLDHLVSQAGALICLALETLTADQQKERLRSDLRSIRGDQPTDFHSISPSSPLWDDTIARLSCRRLVEVQTSPEGLRLTLLAAGKKLLDSLPESNLATWHTRCQFIRTWFGQRATSSSFPQLVCDADRRLEEFAEQHQLTSGDDLVSARFFAAFGRPI